MTNYTPTERRERTRKCAILHQTYRDVTETLQCGNETTTSTPSDRELYMPGAYHAGSYRELERVWHTMRALGKQLAPITYTDSKGVQRKMTVSQAYWQVQEWFIRCPRVQRPATWTIKSPTGKKIKQTGWKVEYLRHPDCREEKVNAAVAWIADKMEGSIDLPDDVTKPIPAQQAAA